MSRFLSLRSLVILAPFVLLIGVMVPLATFAASPAKTAAASASDPTVTVNNRCGTAYPSTVTFPANAGVTNGLEGPQLIKTLNKGQTIKGSAVASSGVDDPAHTKRTAAEQEALSIYAVGPAGGLPFITIVFANIGKQSFEFKAPVNGTQIFACWVLVRADDENDFGLPASQFFAPPIGTTGDHKASVTYSIKS